MKILIRFTWKVRSLSPPHFPFLVLLHGAGQSCIFEGFFCLQEKRQSTEPLHVSEVHLIILHTQHWSEDTMYLFPCVGDLNKISELFIDFFSNRAFEQHRVISNLSHDTRSHLVPLAEELSWYWHSCTLKCLVKYKERNKYKEMYYDLRYHLVIDHQVDCQRTWPIVFVHRRAIGKSQSCFAFKVLI